VRQAATLKQLAEQFHIGVVVTNQVTTHLSKDGMFGSYDVPSENGGSATQMHGATGEQLSPALGTAWSHAVNTRLALDYGDAQWRAKYLANLDKEIHSARTENYRRLTIAKSPVAPNISIPYYISGMGICSSHAL
jgi:hypothetical protein